jgi:hypothetical protein
MKKLIGSTLLKLLGWKVQLDGDLKNLDRCILVEAPHLQLGLSVGNYGILEIWQTSESNH